MDFIYDTNREPAAAQLRTHTRAQHDMVDALYSRFDLAVRASYGAFLTAQYRAVAATESALAAFPSLPMWRPRVELIAADLRELGVALPAPLHIDVDGSIAQAHGLLYVTEGSRLGGRLLIRGVAPAFPISFLSDGHHPGEWKRLLAAINQLAETHPQALTALIAGADAGFRLFAEAATISGAAAAP